MEQNTDTAADWEGAYESSQARGKIQGVQRFDGKQSVVWKQDFVNLALTKRSGQMGNSKNAQQWIRWHCKRMKQGVVRTDADREQSANDQV